MGEFWGGYRLQFKILGTNEFDKLNLKGRRQNAIPSGGRRSFSVDLSVHEFCGDTMIKQIENYDVQVYTERMLVCEKIRALCQQLPEYRAIVKSSHSRARARDYFDIHHIVTQCDIDFKDEEFWNTLVHVFEAKQVPLELLGKVDANRNFHRDDYDSVKNTVSEDLDDVEFDFFADFLRDKLAQLESRWKENPPSR